jgi:dTDP-4-amino-4,6-dideoxygalactose transaminase
MNFKIPLFDLNFDDKEKKAIIDTLNTNWISTGPKNTEFENKFASMLGVKYALALTNCTVALHLAFIAAGIGEDDEVICPSLTFAATVNAIRYVNAVPVFCDIKSNDDLTIDPGKMENLITAKTRAIIVMHYGGFPCEMDKITAIARKHDLKVIEDAAHAPLSEYKGKKLGTIGDIGCFSFFSNKNISAGEGGMLVTNNKEYYEEARLLRSHGMTSLSYERAAGHSTDYDVVRLGYNYRMDDIRASIGIAQLAKLENDLKIRAEIRKSYIKKLENIERIIIPFKENRNFVSNYIFPVVLKDSSSTERDALRNDLRKEGIQTSVHYPSVNRFTIYKPFYRQQPLAEYVSDCEITLPMYSSLKPEDIDYVTQRLKKYLDKLN